MEFGKTVWVKVNSLKRLLDAHKKKTACSRPRFGGAAHLFELNEDKTQPIVLTRLWDRKTVRKCGGYQKEPGRTNYRNRPCDAFRRSRMALLSCS